MNHRFRFSTSGNPTKHMPIGYLSLWCHVSRGEWPQMTLVDLETHLVQCQGHIQSCIDNINYPHSSQSHHAKLRLLTISQKSCRRWFLLWRHNFVTWPDLLRRNLVEGGSSYDVITSWPDLIWPIFSTKVAQKMPNKLWKISARFSKRCDIQLRQTHGGLHHAPWPG